MPRIDAISTNAAVAGFALFIAVLTGVLSSLVPAWAAARRNLLEDHKENARSGTSSLRQTWLCSSLVVAEIAIATVLLSVSLAFLHSYQQMLAVDHMTREVQRISGTTPSELVTQVQG